MRRILCLFLTISICLPVVSSQDNLTSGHTGTQILLDPAHVHDFLEVYTGQFSDVQFYTVSANGFEKPLTIYTEKPFAISLHCHEEFTQSITLEPHQGSIPDTRIYVRFFPQVTGVHESEIAHTSDNAESLIIALKGTATESQVPQEYYASATGEGHVLKTQLFHIIQNHQVQSYASLWTHFASTDATFSGNVWDIYSDTPCEEPLYTFSFTSDQDSGSGGTQEGQVYNREHSMPVSWFGGQEFPMYTDLFHIFPVDKWVNALRENHPYGEVSRAHRTTQNGGKLGPGKAEGYTGTVFEPIDAYKGDLARAYFYMLTRYEDLSYNWNFSEEGMQVLDQNTWPGFTPWAIEMLLKWHALDPVSQKEIRRNNLVFQIQGNRNPYIDHPGFAEKVWSHTTVTAKYPLSDQHISVYPNPARGYITIDSREYMQSVALFSSDNNLVFRYDSMHQVLKLELPETKAGIYFLKIQTASRTEVIKLMLF